jgi:hypothetical protein
MLYDDSRVVVAHQLSRWSNWAAHPRPYVPQPPLPIPLAGTFYQAPNPGPLNSFDWLRFEGDKKLAMLQQLYAHVLDLLSEVEQKQMLNAHKVSNVMSPSSATSGTIKTAPTTIYAEYPWKQPLRHSPGHGSTAQGRQVKIARHVKTAHRWVASQRPGHRTARSGCSTHR